ncbi:hypothetical protein BDR05DRAFT_831755, partial [Suillus weaverae]
LNDADICHHTKLWELILDTFNEYFEVLKSDLLKAQGKVSFTSDPWSDSNLCPFMAITAHWIAKED